MKTNTKISRDEVIAAFGEDWVNQHESNATDHLYNFANKPLTTGRKVANATKAICKKTWECISSRLTDEDSWRVSRQAILSAYMRLRLTPQLKRVKPRKLDSATVIIGNLKGYRLFFFSFLSYDKFHSSFLGIRFWI